MAIKLQQRRSHDSRVKGTNGTTKQVVGIMLLLLSTLAHLYGSMIVLDQPDLVLPLHWMLPLIGIFETNHQGIQKSKEELLIKRKGNLPTWMTEYFDWHQRTRSFLNESNWDQTEYLILTCYNSTVECGGVSDRLKTLPFVLWHAAKYRRMIFIDWERPAPLEKFLVPPQGSLDWRLPSWLKPFLKQLGRHPTIISCTNPDNMLSESKAKVFDVVLRVSDGCEPFFVNATQSTFADVYHDLFRVFFEPVERIQTQIDSVMSQKGLVPGEYSATHLRNLYGKMKWRHPNHTIEIVMHGINCASTQGEGAPVYFASDDKFAVQVAMTYGQQYSLPVVSLELPKKPLHFDLDPDWKTRDPSAYDDTFIDLYMLGQARCVAYSNGGYGTFGSLLSYNASCGTRFFKAHGLVSQYNWTYRYVQPRRSPPGEHPDGAAAGSYLNQVSFPAPAVEVTSEMLIDPEKKE